MTGGVSRIDGSSGIESRVRGVATDDGVMGAVKIYIVPRTPQPKSTKSAMQLSDRMIATDYIMAHTNPGYDPNGNTLPDRKLTGSNLNITG